jgi:hypothetical protein
MLGGVETGRSIEQDELYRNAKERNISLRNWRSGTERKNPRAIKSQSAQPPLRSLHVVFYIKVRRVHQLIIQGFSERHQKTA